MKKRLVAAVLALTMSLSLAACAGADKKETKSDKEISEMSFDELKEEAKGTTVTFYGWGGDEMLNDWLDNEFAPVMKEKYDITMELSLIHI